jgi:hypothetical protein
LLLAIITTPLLVPMRGPNVDTPDQSLSWNMPVLALYGCYFTLGRCLHHERDLLEVLARRWKRFLLLGIGVSLLPFFSAAAHYGGGARVTEHAVAFKWVASLAATLTMALSVFGWLGCFVRFFRCPSDKIRYLADASYWIYVAHLPLVLGLQIGLAKWALPWWLQLPLLNGVALIILLTGYHAFVRFTWVGRLVKRAPRAAAGPPCGRGAEWF